MLSVSILKVWTFDENTQNTYFRFVPRFDENDRSGVKQIIKILKAYPRLMVVVYLLKGGTEARSKSK